MFQTVLFVCVGYLSGSVLYALIFAGILKKEDILAQSSDHNPGTANAFMYGGFWCGLFTLLFDLLKGFIPVYLFMHYGNAAKAAPFMAALVIAAPVIGHAFPVFYGFRGGKGIAVTFGCLAGLIPALEAFWVLVFFFIGFSTVLQVENTDSLIGIWSVLNVEEYYPFSNNEKEMMKDIRKVMILNNYDPMTLYHYGLYVNSVAGEMKGLDKKKITESYNSLVIQRRQDLDISSEDIIDCMKKEPGEYISDIYEDIEKEVLYHRLPNEKEKLLSYIRKNYASND